MLLPRILIPPRVISARTMKMIEQSAGNLKKGRASVPIDLLHSPRSRFNNGFQHPDGGAGDGSEME